MLHSTAIPPKEQVNNPREAERFPDHFSRLPQAPQRIPLAKPGKIASPIKSFENGSIKEPANPRRWIHNAMLPPQPGLPPAFQRNVSKIGSEKAEATEEERDHNSRRRKPPQPFMAGKMAPEVAIDTRVSPFYISGSHRKIDAAQFGIPGIY